MQAFLDYPPATSLDWSWEWSDIVSVFLPQLSQLGKRKRGHGVHSLLEKTHTRTHKNTVFFHQTATYISLATTER